MKRFLSLFPLVVSLLLIFSLYSFLSNNNKELTSVLIEKDIPYFSLEKLENMHEVVTPNDIKLPAIMNVWATWCITCKIEHPFLMQLKAEEKVNTYGINYKDDREKAMKLLKDDGNPFIFSIFDDKGRLAIDLGVYGAPETFLIDKKGKIRVRHVGELNQKIWNEKFQDVIYE
mgnify:CR=1 FL=1|tara:strand:+ start:37543 stop:38061 length:519 start_codon:yes stop_codon:yes gene_type:complete